MGVKVVKVVIDETAGSGEYDAVVEQPAGSKLVGIIVTNINLWGSADRAHLYVGDAEAVGGYQHGVDLKTLTAGWSQDLDRHEETAGLYVQPNGLRRYTATDRDILIKVVAAGAGGGAGLTHVEVLYTEPNDTVHATKS